MRPALPGPPRFSRADALRALGAGVGLFLLVNLAGQALRPPFEILAEWVRVPVADIQPASAVRIEPLEAPEKGFFLFYLDASGNQIADGWHFTLDEAKRQAKVEFEIEEEDWSEVSPT